MVRTYAPYIRSSHLRVNVFIVTVVSFDLSNTGTYGKNKCNIFVQDAYVCTYGPEYNLLEDRQTMIRYVHRYVSLRKYVD